MAFVWNEEFETGDRVIDGQHKMLFEMLNSLGCAIRDGKGPDEVRRTLDFLTSYTLKHFSDEERLQRLYRYPEYLLHKHYHDDFRAVISTLLARLDREGASHEVLTAVYISTGSWLVNHIKGDDFKFAGYMLAYEEDRQKLLAMTGRSLNKGLDLPRPSRLESLRH